MGAYTAAAFHFIRSGQINQAVWGWRAVQNQEIEHGQAQTARALSRPLLQTELEPQTKEALTIICSQLERFTGNLSQAAEDLQETLIQTPILQIEAAELAGIIGNDQSNFAQAEEIMRRGLQTADALVGSRIALIRKGLGWLHMRQREFEQADQELALAQYEIENLRGKIAFERCEYNKAKEHYQQALAIAEKNDYQEGIAKTATNLGQIYLFRGGFDMCQESLKLAYEIHRKMGKTLAMAGSQLTLAVAHNQSGEHLRALKLLQQAENLTSPSKSSEWVQALITQARAEAYLGLGQLDLAETHIQEAISFEELDILPDAYRVYGEILTQRGDFDAAQQALQHGLSLAEEYSDPYLCGYIWRALGKLYQTRGETENVNDAFDKAIEAFTEINLPNEVERQAVYLPPRSNNVNSLTIFSSTPAPQPSRGRTWATPLTAYH